MTPLGKGPTIHVHKHKVLPGKMGPWSPLICGSNPSFLSFLLVLESVITPERAFVKSGSEVTFECLSYTNSDASNVSYEWAYPLELAGGVTVDGGVLIVAGADLNAEVNFTCTVVLEGSGLTDIAVSSLEIGELILRK